LELALHPPPRDCRLGAAGLLHLRPASAGRHRV